MQIPEHICEQFENALVRGKIDFSIDPRASDSQYTKYIVDEEAKALKIVDKLLKKNKKLEKMSL